MSYDFGFKEKDDATGGPMAQFRVSIDDAVYQKINYWVQKAPGEVSGLGKVVIDKSGVFRVVDACLVKQENTGSSTEMEAQAVAKAMFEMRESPGHLNFWWHSHADFGVFWSGTDIDTIRQIGSHGFVLATVFNKKREMLSAIYLKPSELIPEVFLDTVPTQIQAYLDPQAVTEWEREYVAKCETKYTWNGKWNDYGRTTQGQLAIEHDDSNPFDFSQVDTGHRSPMERDADAIQRMAEEKADKLEMDLQVLEDLADDMEEETDYKEAQRILTRLCRAVAKHPLLTQQAKTDLKGEYIERFNTSRSDHLRRLARVTQQ